MNVTTPKKRPQIEPLSIKQIVVAVDLSPHYEKTVAYAVGIARGDYPGACVSIGADYLFHYGAHSRLLRGRTAYR